MAQGQSELLCCCRFHPDDDKQNVIMAGCGDKKVYQWDSDTGDLVQVSKTSSIWLFALRMVFCTLSKALVRSTSDMMHPVVV